MTRRAVPLAWDADVRRCRYCAAPLPADAGPRVRYCPTPTISGRSRCQVKMGDRMRSVHARLRRGEMVGQDALPLD